MSIGAMAAPLSGSPLGGLLGGLKDAATGASSSSTGDAIGGLLNGLLGTDKISPESMVGTWAYTAPAVCFQSENFLQKAGGAAAAGTIEGKLAPYYKKFGVDKLTLTVDKDMKFTMTNGKLSASGTIVIEDKDVYFNFTAAGKIKLGKIRTYVTQSGSEMSVMFDVSKLMAVVKGVSSITGNTTIATATKLLESYDGICAGFKLKKQ